MINPYETERLRYHVASVTKTADAMLTITGPGIESGDTDLPLLELKPDWKNVQLEAVCTAITDPGSNGVDLKVVTSNDVDTALSTSSTVAKKADGSTDAKLDITAIGRQFLVIAREDADSFSTLADLLGLFLDVGSVTSITLEVFISIT
ncbi:MAG: hypothetical protein U9P90_02335 [Patescibacteria group bacterium]|nr:hypothetical protein [Patescibacteria group bacterium]